MKKLIVISKKILVVLGAISLSGGMVIGGFVAFQLFFGNKTKINSASERDIRFVLNWCNLGGKKIDKIVNSYVSARSFTGDHLDAYAFKVESLSVDELTQNDKTPGGRWYRGDQLPKVLDDAVSMVGNCGGGEVSWFPKKVELRSCDVYIYLCSIYYHNIKPTAVNIIFVRPKDKMVFFFGLKT